MSAGAFSRSRYQGDAGSGGFIHPIRIQPETALAEVTADGTANDPPVGEITNTISAVQRIGRRGRGLRPRYISIQSSLTDPPDGYLPGGITRLPCLTPAFFVAASPPGTQITYLGATWETISGEPERVR